MATYVFSDIHGHVKPLQRALERIQPTESDVFYCLGDMIDRGPSSVETIRTVRSLPNCTVLMGNHEQMAISALSDSSDIESLMSWQFNGGDATIDEFKDLSSDEFSEVVDWLKELPLFTVITVAEQYYVLVHAGIRALGTPLPNSWDDTLLMQYLHKQNDHDLVWIREDFWGRSTELHASDGQCPIVICGHTPTPLLESFGAHQLNRSAVTSDGLAQWVQVDGDKWGIDTGTTGGPGYGQVTVLRLDDLQEFVEPLQEGE